MSQFSFDAIGTKWGIYIYENISAAKEIEILAAIRARVDVFDKNYSRFRADSLVTTFSQMVGEFTLPGDAQPMI